MLERDSLFAVLHVFSFISAVLSQKMKERILIGSDLDIQRRLKENRQPELLCDVTRPLSSFLIDFENDTLENWNQFAISPLQNSLNTNRWKQPDLEQPASDFLTKNISLEIQ